MEKKSRKRKKLNKTVILIAALVLIAAALAGIMVFRQKAKAAAAPAQENRTATVAKQSITSTLSSSGTLAAKDTYTITSLVEGEVTMADFSRRRSCGERDRSSIRSIHLPLTRN